MPTFKKREYSKEWDAEQKLKFNAILDYDIKDVLRETSTEYNFLEIKSKAEYIQLIVDTLAKNYPFWSQLSDQYRVEVNNSLEDIKNVFYAMLNFDPKQDNAWAQRSELLTRFNDIYNTFYKSVVMHLNSYLGNKAYSKELSSSFGQQAKEQFDEILRIKGEIENVHRATLEATNIASKTASGKIGRAFDDQAHEHSKSANWWFLALIGYSLIMTVVGGWLVWSVLNLSNTSTSIVDEIKLSIIKIVIIGFLFVMFRFISRNYSTHKHLYVVNKHRANVMKSFDAYKESAFSDDAKDQVLIGAIASAFAHQESGFITTKEGAGSEDGDVMKIITNLISKK